MTPGVPAAECFAAIGSCRIGDSKRAITVANLDKLGCGVEADIVRIVERAQLRGRLEIVGIKGANRAVVTIGEIDAVGFRQQQSTCGFMKTGYRVQPLKLCNVEDFGGVVAESRDDEPVGTGIIRKVIEPSLYALQGDRMDKSQRLARVGEQTD